jgi:lysophospholipase L1-like esterase
MSRKNNSLKFKCFKPLAIFIFIFSLLCNPFVVEQLFSPDHHLDFLWKYIVIALFELMLLIVAIIFYFKPKWVINYYKKILLVIILCCIAISVSVFIYYISMSIYIRVSGMDSWLINTEEYGWDNYPNISQTYAVTDSDGSIRNVTRIAYDYGYKRLPSANSSAGKIRILVLGDSFTEAVDISNGKEYYSYLENIPNVSVFVKGVGGWGTTQEYVFLKNHVKEINPNIIILQFCYNDFINNDYYLSKYSIVHNSGRGLPFLENGSIVYRDDARIQLPFLKHTRFQRITNYFYKSLLLHIVPYTKTLDYTLQHDPESIPAFNESIYTTKELFLMMRNASNGAKIFSFGNCEKYLNSTEYYNRITSETGIEVIRGVDEAVNNASQHEVVFVKDYFHWNPKGHEIAGKIISQHIQDYIDKQYTLISKNSTYEK